MNLDQAKEYLSGCDRHELRDHAFGDTEITWMNDKDEFGSGYFSGSASLVTVYVKPNVSYSFKEDEARQLRNCGTLVETERNDETGPDEYQEGFIMPGLTKEAIFEEITASKERHPSG